MSFHVDPTAYVCSGCGARDDYKRLFDGHGRSYLQCLKCEHNNKLPDDDGLWKLMSGYEPPKEISF